MAAAQPARWSASHERGSSIRSRAESEPEHSLSRNGVSLRTTEENRFPPALPKAFSSMLKTTTETGDIGVFSIKPPRVPQPLNSARRIGGTYIDNLPQRPRTFQAYSHTGVDDRVRLPSYSRDAASEVISMYETASQKFASRMFDDPDYRSHSMTQTYSTYSLSNHRSYASLRSQPEGNTLLQRPRSPFAYPARLKRPGFRPSSPVLTDGGEVDYSRRAEIERIPCDDRRGASSPSSLYAQKRRLPHSLRPDGNRSTPSLLSQASPARRSPSPHMRQGNGTPTIDWQRRNGPASVSTSPARSTLSLASTMNLYQVAPALSSTTTSGKIHPPSPLYYDYTEDFDIDDYNQPEALDPPPQFRIDKTIPEDRPLSSGENTKASGFIAFTDAPFSPYPIPAGGQGSFNGFLELRSNNASLGSELEPMQNGDRTDTVPIDNLLPNNSARTSEEKRVIRLSGLGLRARELNSHVEEAFGLLTSPSFELLVPVEDQEKDDDKVPSSSILDGVDNEIGPYSARTSSYSLNTALRQFPPPPIVDISDTDSFAELGLGKAGLISRDSTSPENSIMRRCPPQYEDSAGSSHDWRAKILPTPPQLPSTKNDREHSDLRTSDEKKNGGTEDLILRIEQSSSLRRVHKTQTMSSTSQKISSLPPELSTVSLSHKPSGGHRTRTQHSSNHQQSSDQNRHVVPPQKTGWYNSKGRKRRMEVATIPSYGEADVPNFSHQIPRKLMSRSESPMLAPKPISPARQLKLKNSVPRLMKALPPLPPEQLVRAVSPPLQLLSSEVELPCRFSPLVAEARPSPSGETQHTPEPLSSSGTVQTIGAVAGPAELDSRPVDVITKKPVEENTPFSSQPPQKLKLKKRSVVDLRPTSSSDSRPWNLEESYPWSSRHLKSELPTVVDRKNSINPKPPKFKLKITRASNSNLGTVRINRESSCDSRVSTGLHLPNPKDLFTPNSGIDGIFRQFGNHLHSRRESVNSYPILLLDNPASPAPGLTTIKQPSSQAVPVIQPSPTSSTSPKSLPEGGGSYFSEDSSRIYSQYNLRKKLTNFRARISVPYKSRIGSQSHDDITWRDQNETPPLGPAAARSHIHLPLMSSDHRHTRRHRNRLRTQNLRTKVSEWFKGAKSAIASRVRTRTATSSI